MSKKIEIIKLLEELKFESDVSNPKFIHLISFFKGYNLAIDDIIKCFKKI